MPKFSKLDPNEVHIGRGRAAFEARKKFVEAVGGSEAGRVDLERGDRPTTVKRLLQEAAKQAGVKVRSTWTDRTQRTLVWKKTRSSR